MNTVISLKKTTDDKSRGQYSKGGKSYNTPTRKLKEQIIPSADKDLGQLSCTLLVGTSRSKGSNSYADTGALTTTTNATREVPLRDIPDKMPGHQAKT